MVPDLIYDVGMNNGNDTAYYLHRGFRVVAVEANPVLAEQCQERFRDAIAEGRLTILNVGIGPREGEATFWVNDVNSEWSSFVKEVGCRDGTACHSIEIPGVRFHSILQDHGVPFYLKIDIERADVHCLEDLDPGDLPRYVSVEAHDLHYLGLLSALGFDRFKCINQVNHNHPEAAVDNESRKARLNRAIGRRPLLARAVRGLRLRRIYRALRGGGSATATPAPVASDLVFPEGSSGPFGDETIDAWQPLEPLAYNWLHLQMGHHDRGKIDMDGWHDFHATRAADTRPGGAGAATCVDTSRTVDQAEPVG